MTERLWDPLVRRVRQWCARVCPPTIQERVVDQALADLAHERASLPAGVLRTLLTMEGLARVVLALALSLVLLRRAWREARWWPAAVVGGVKAPDTSAPAGAIRPAGAGCADAFDDQIRF